MLTVEIDAFSGMPNPTWDLPAADLKGFLNVLRSDPDSVRSLADVEDKLGFRGYIIHADGDEARRLQVAGLPSTFRVNDRKEATSRRKAALALLEMESGLWAGAGTSEPVSVEGSDGSTLAAAAAACSLAYTSWDDFSFWNGTRKDQNNCYNYAANYASNSPNGRATPGLQSGHPLTGPSNAAMTNALHSDGWKSSCPGSSLRIYAVSGYGPFGWDFHFYRKNLNDAGASRWCHKRGLTRAKNTDESGNYITNPANADRSFYTNVIGTFFSPAGDRSVVVR